MSNVIHHEFKKPHVDPWRHAQPTLKSSEDREELWAHPYFGISHMIWATGSHDTPDPPRNGGSPVAANMGGYQQLKVAA